MIPAGHPEHDPDVPDNAGEWYACQHPERPHDPDWTAYWTDCRACMLALQAARQTGAAPDLRDVDLRTPADPLGLHTHVTAYLKP